MKLQIELSKFYTEKDELRFFIALREISALKSIQGVGRSLILDLELRGLGRDSLFELIGILTRYQISLKPLGILADRSKFAWLKDKRWYWYAGMFDK